MKTLHRTDKMLEIDTIDFLFQFPFVYLFFTLASIGDNKYLFLVARTNTKL